MEKRVKLLVTFTFLIILVASLYFFTDWFSKVTGYFAGEDDKTKLAQCLNEKGAELYTALYCPDCEKQKQIFGKALELISKIDCDEADCSNIRELPAWYFNKTFHYGYKNLTELDDISGCNILSN